MSVHIDNVADLRVAALRPWIKGGESFLASSGGLDGTTWSDAVEIVRRHFPDAVRHGVLPNDRKAATKRVRLDAGKTEGVF
jgi:hypothetical protein